MFENYTSASVNMPAVLIANGLGICLMLAILLSRYRRTRTTSIDGKLFYSMCLLCFVLCTVETAGFLLEGQTFFPARQLSLLCSAVTLCLAAVLAFLWICYVTTGCFRTTRGWKNTIPSRPSPPSSSVRPPCATSCLTYFSGSRRITCITAPPVPPALCSGILLHHLRCGTLLPLPEAVEPVSVYAGANLFDPRISGQHHPADHLRHRSDLGLGGFGPHPSVYQPAK